MESMRDGIRDCPNHASSLVLISDPGFSFCRGKNRGGNGPNHELYFRHGPMPQARGRDYYGDTSEAQKGLTTEYASDDTEVKEIKKEMTVSESNETFGDRFKG